MERKDTNRFGTLLRQYRIALGLTQEELAERAGIGVRTIKGMEQRQRHVPRADTLHRVVTALQLGPDQSTALLGALRHNGAHGHTNAPAHATNHVGDINTLTPLIGREDFIENALALLYEDTTRLMTLVGPPGVGKTRIGLEIAQRASRNRAYLFDQVEGVALASLSQPDLVLPAIIHAMGVREVGGTDPVDALERAIRGKKVLLFLDNFEHLLNAASDVVTVLARCTELKILITSRAALRVRGEREMPVPPLQAPALVNAFDVESTSGRPSRATRTVAGEHSSAFMPERPDIPFIAGGVVLRAPGATGLVSAIMDAPSVMLFVQRAQATTPEFRISEQNAPIIAAICRQLDGLPLAIELAAARIRLLAPAEILTRLANRLSLLVERGPDLPSRQQTMRDAIEWSYLLLSPNEQWTFRRLGVFANGFSLEAAESICSRDGNAADVLDDLTALIANNLIYKVERSDGGSQIFMLETIRAYALEQLDIHHERDLVAGAHSAYYCSYVEAQAGTSLAGQQSFDLKALDDDYANLQAALGWAIDHRDVATAERMIAGTWRYWYTRGILTEGRRWIDSLMDMVGQIDLEWIRVASSQGTPQNPSVTDDQRTREGDSFWEAHTRSPYLAAALNGAGMIAFRQGDYDTATSWLRRSLALHRWRDDSRGAAAALNNLGIVLADQGRHTEAESFHEESLALKRTMGSLHDVAVALNNLGCVARARGQYARAKAYFEENLAIQRARGDTYRIGHALGNLGTQAYVQGDFDHAYELYLECLSLQQQIGDRQGVAVTRLNLAEVAKERGDLDQALIQGSEGLVMFRTLGEPTRIVSALSLLVTVNYAKGDAQSARACLNELLLESRSPVPHRSGHQWTIALACMGYDEGLFTVAVQFLAAANSNKTNGTVWTPTEQRDYEECLQQSRKRLDASVFDNAWEVASAWSWQDVLAHARRFLAHREPRTHEEAGA